MEMIFFPPCIIFYFLSISIRAIQSTHPPTHPPVPNPPPPNSIALGVGRKSWATKPNSERSILSPLLQNSWNPTHPKTIRFWWILRLPIEFFNLIWLISATKTVRFGKYTPDLEILSAIWWKNHRIWRTFHQIWLDLAKFQCFSVVFDGFRLHSKMMPTQQKIDLWNPTHLRVTSWAQTQPTWPMDNPN